MHPYCPEVARSSAKDARGFKLEDLVVLSMLLGHLDAGKAAVRLRFVSEKTWRREVGPGYDLASTGLLFRLRGCHSTNAL
jgi:hypothetical protein